MYLRNVEPTIDELLEDPIAGLLMARDGVRAETVWMCIRTVGQKLSGQAARDRESDSPEAAAARAIGRG